MLLLLILLLFVLRTCMMGKKLFQNILLNPNHFWSAIIYFYFISKLYLFCPSDHSFGTCAKVSKKRTFLSSHMCAYQEVNVNFPENFLFIRLQCCSKRTTVNWKISQTFMDLIYLFNPFLVNDPISYLLKTLKNLWLSGVFRKYKMRSLTRNGLNSFKKLK